MGLYRQDSSPQPWMRKTSRVLVVLTRLRLSHTRLTAHLHRLRLSPAPYCPWCQTVPETIEHFLLHCPRFYLHRAVLQSTPSPKRHHIRPAHLAHDGKYSPLSTTSRHPPHLCLPQEDRTVFSPVMPSQDSTRAHRILAALNNNNNTTSQSTPHVNTSPINHSPTWNHCQHILHYHN